MGNDELYSRSTPNSCIHPFDKYLNTYYMPDMVLGILWYSKKKKIPFLGTDSSEGKYTINNNIDE